MAKEKRQEEVFGEDFDLLEGIEDIIRYDEDDSEEQDEQNQDDTGVENDGNEDDESDGSENDSNEDNEEGTDSDDAENSSSSPLIPYAKYLKEEGVLPNFDLEKFDGSIESLREGMFNEILSGVEQYKASLPEPVRRVLDNYEDGVPLETMLQIDRERARYISYKDIDLESEDVQRELVRDYLARTTKFSKEKIEREITRLGDLQELEDEARTVLPELIALQDEIEASVREQAKEQQRVMEEQRLQELESLRTTIEGTSEIVPGIKLSDTLRQKIYKNLTTPVAYAENGQPLNRLGLYRSKNPVQTEIVLNYIFEATNEFRDWGVFSKGAKKAVVQEIEAAARNLDAKQSRAGNNPIFHKTEKTKKFLDNIDEYIGE
jgi:hypothetical protein